MEGVKSTRTREYETRLLNRNWLSDKTFEIELSKPSDFTFFPGQRINLSHDDLEREYSMISTPEDPTISLCIRYVDEGIFSQLLGNVKIGTVLKFRGPSGYFTFQSSPRPVVFVATDTGIAPFVSMGRAGASNFLLLHGVRTPADLYYESFFRTIAGTYVPCISDISRGPSPEACYHGRVTDYIKRRLQPSAYDFYLCGTGSMIRDVTSIVDDHFPDSRVYMDRFY